MRNERGAGRKPKLDSTQLEQIRQRHLQGETITILAKEYAVSRQTLYGYLYPANPAATFSMEYLVDGSCTTRIELDLQKEIVHTIHYTENISERALGIYDTPDWKILGEWLERLYFAEHQVKLEPGEHQIFCQNMQKNWFMPLESASLKLQKDVLSGMPKFAFTKKDILYTRTDTMGYQPKALSRDRRWFVKSQAIIGGIAMDDWAVEVIASRLCEQLDIACVSQNVCRFAYANAVYYAVYAANFELDGYTFISFQTLVSHTSDWSEDAFIHMSAIDKMKYCARILAQVGNLEYEQCLKYMLDLALIDILVGNVDRHMHNFGLFYNVNAAKYEIPLIFDNGMGLFEHDSYRDSYESFDQAMRNVYIAPYGEDPFAFYELLDQEFDLLQQYPALKALDYKKATANIQWITPFAREYIERVSKLWQK